MLHLRRLIILIDAEEADIEIVTRIFKVIGIPSKEADIRFRRKDQPHIGIALIAVERILAPLEKRHYVAAQTGRLQRFLLQPAHHFPPRLERLLGAQLRRDDRIDLLRHILDAHQDIELQIMAFELLGAGACVESIGQNVLLLGGELLQRSGAHMMIGEHEPILRDE